MPSDKFTEVKIRKTTLSRIREIAELEQKTPPKMLDEMLKVYELYIPIISAIKANDTSNIK